MKMKMRDAEMKAGDGGEHHRSEQALDPACRVDHFMRGEHAENAADRSRRQRQADDPDDIGITGRDNQSPEDDRELQHDVEPRQDAMGKFRPSNHLAASGKAKHPVEAGKNDEEARSDQEGGGATDLLGKRHRGEEQERDQMSGWHRLVQIDALRSPQLRSPVPPVWRGSSALCHGAHEL